MTTKDIRDIAAYWGAPCSYSIGKLQWEDWSWDGQRMGKWGEPFFSRVDNAKIDKDFISALHRENTTIDGLKVHLRQIKSLTDNEINALYCAIQCKEYDEDLQKKVFRNKYEFAIDFSYPLGDSRNATFVMYGTRIKFDGLIYTEVAEYNGGCQDAYCDNAQAGYAYLQSIGIYVPGTINKDFVTLI